MPLLGLMACSGTGPGLGWRSLSGSPPDLLLAFLGGISDRLLLAAVYAEGQKKFEEFGLLRLFQVCECVPLLLRSAAVR